MTAFNLSFLNCRQPNQNIPTTSKLAKSSLDIEGYHYNNCTCTIAATMTSPLVNDASKAIRDYREMQAINSINLLKEEIMTLLQRNCLSENVLSKHFSRSKTEYPF